MASQLTVEDLMEMMALVDGNGDQDVSKKEFQEYCAKAMDIQGDEFEKMWKLIDDNGDGILQFSELCSYFGVSVDEVEEGAKKKKEMSDEDIMQALALSSKMYEQKQAVKAEEEAKKKRALTKRAAGGAREGVKIIKSTDKESAEAKLLEACEMIDRTDRDTAMEMLGWQAADKEQGTIGQWTDSVSVQVRIEDGDKREMPLHKLARNHEHVIIMRIYDLVTKATGGKDEAKSDINSQNKDGKTPLMLAVEGNLATLNGVEADPAKLAAYREKQVKTVQLLLNCQADMYVESITGWNTLHSAAHGNSFEAAKEMFSFMDKNAFSTLAVRLLVNHKDKDGRTPLHIAAMRADAAVDKPPFVQLLLNKGGDPLIRDNGASLTAAGLAEKAGRRNSKELLDIAAEEREQQTKSYNHRRKSLSRELPDVSQLQVAAK